MKLLPFLFEVTETEKLNSLSTKEFVLGMVIDALSELGPELIDLSNQRQISNRGNFSSVSFGKNEYGINPYIVVREIPVKASPGSMEIILDLSRFPKIGNIEERFIMDADESEDDLSGKVGIAMENIKKQILFRSQITEGVDERFQTVTDGISDGLMEFGEVFVHDATEDLRPTLGANGVFKSTYYATIDFSGTLLGDVEIRFESSLSFKQEEELWTLHAQAKITRVVSDAIEKPIFFKTSISVNNEEEIRGRLNTEIFSKLRKLLKPTV